MEGTDWLVRVLGIDYMATDLTSSHGNNGILDAVPYVCENAKIRHQKQLLRCWFRRQRIKTQSKRTNDKNVKRIFVNISLCVYPNVYLKYLETDFGYYFHIQKDTLN